MIKSSLVQTGSVPFSSASSTASTMSNSSSTTTMSTTKRTSRLPESLKRIFIEAQQGKEVHEPPADKSAFQTFEDLFPAMAPAAGHKEKRRRRFLLEQQPSLADIVSTTAPSSCSNDDNKNKASLVDLLSAVEVFVDQTMLQEAKQEEEEHEKPRQPRQRRQDNVDSGGIQTQSLHRRASAGGGASSTSLAAEALLLRSKSFKAPSKLSGSNKKKKNNSNSNNNKPIIPFAGDEAPREGQQEQPASSSCPISMETICPKSTTPYPTVRSPQVFLDVMLRTLGYSTDCFYTLETSYFNKPTNLQMVSNHARLHDLLGTTTTTTSRGSRCQEGQQEQRRLSQLLSCGLSSNPCNSHGESLLHAACRLGRPRSVQIMLQQCGTILQVSNDFGRTPLHDALFSASTDASFFELIDLLLKHDRHLLHLRDRHGATPLSFVPRSQWGIWIDFIYAKRHDYFPKRNKRVDGIAPSSPRMHEAPNSRPIPDPENALPLDIAALVASGKLSCEEAQCLVGEEDDENDDEEGEYEDGNDTTSVTDGLYDERCCE